jgi:hypothetical protein
MNDLRHVQVSNFYFRVMWIITVFLYILIPFGSGMLSILYLSIIGITVFVFLCVIIFLCKSNPSYFNLKSFILFFLITVELLLSACFGRGELPIKDVFIGSLGYLEMMMALIILNYLQFSRENISFLLNINILIAIIFVILSCSGFAYSGRLPLLYLGYSNPNTTAIYLLLNQAILITFLGNIQKRWIKYGVFILCVHEVYLLFLTGSRTCLIASILIVVFYLSGKRIHIPKILIVAAILFPLIFVGIYTGLYATGQYTNQMFLGKELFSGRERLFYETVSQLSNVFLFGDVKHYNFTNLHNAPLTIISSVGIVGYILYVLYYLNFLFHYYTRNSSIQQNIALVTILATFFHSSSEAVLMVGGAQYSVIIATFYWILKGVIESYDKEMT